MRAPSFPAVRYRLTSILLGFLVVVSATVVGAQADGPVRFPEASVLATSGEAIEAVLADVGLDAAWRSVVDLHPGARVMTVTYRGSEADAVAALVRASFELSSVEASREEVIDELRTTAVALDNARQRERARAIDRNRAEAYFLGIHALTQSVAIDVFSGEDPSTEALLGLDGQALTVAQRQFELTNTTLDEMMELRALAELDLDDATAALGTATATRVELEQTHAGLVDDATDLTAQRRALDASARAILPAAAEAFTLASIPGQPGMTTKALNAYLNAESTMVEVAPGCGISWRTIAAVASVEGLHGEYGDRRVGIDGRPDSPIVGIALDGATVDNFGDSTANLSDTDGGRYDQDPLHDRAVGPLQFIPQTWAKWGRDGDGDGEADPQDIDDAALATAAYLCSYGSLRDWTGWSRAIFGYNHSGPYVNSIKASLDRVLGLGLPGFDGDDELRQPGPSGAWVPAPVPPPVEPPPTSVTEATG